MKTYQKWYWQIVQAGLFGLLAILLTMGVALAEETIVSNTDDVSPGAVQLVTQSADGNGVYAHHAAQGMAEDGSFVFTSNATNLMTPATTGGVYRFYFYDNATQTITALPEFGTDRLGSAGITHDKQWVVLNTFDYTLKIDKVFLYNTATAELMSMTKADGTTLAVKGLSITADGTVVAFSSLEKLVTADTNNLLDVYLWHRDSQTIELASKKSGGTAAGIESFGAISADGMYVSYIASGSNFPTCGTQTYYDIYRHNVQTGEVQCVSGEVDDSDHEVFRSFQMSADGSMFAFAGILEGIQPKFTNYYLVNLSQGTTPTVVFDKATFESLNFHRLTADGTRVIYSKGIYTDPNNLRKFCSYVVATATHSCTTRPEGTQDGDLTAISPTGRFSVISSWDHSWIGSTADNLKTINNELWDDLFIWDRDGVNNAISGKVTGDDGVTGLEDVTLTNGTRERYVTDATGQYTMPYLTAGQTYVITPTLSGKTIYPINKMVTAPSGNVNFSTQQKFTISGHMTDRDGKGIANAVIKTDTGDYLTDVNGFYSIASLAPGSYVLTPTVTGLGIVPPLLRVNLAHNEDSVDFQALCESPYTGLNVCDLQIGDVLLFRGDFAVWSQSPVNIIARNLVGTYWWHSAIYVGNLQIAEATGGQEISREANEVWVRDIGFTRWWYTPSDYDWSVIRPKAHHAAKQVAVEYAISIANQDDPPVRYSSFANRTDDDPTYCSKLVWKAYMLSNIDLERRAFILDEELITSDELYYSAYSFGGVLTTQSEVVQEKEWSLAKRALFYIFSPADLLLTDSQGRRVGYDALTGITYAEIPGAFYTGPDTEPEHISLLVSTNLTWTLDVVGTGNGGQYTIKTAVISGVRVLTDTVAATIEPGEKKTYFFNNQAEQPEDLLEEQQVIENKKQLYLPIVFR